MKKDEILQKINILKNKNSNININQTNNFYQQDITIEFDEERFKDIIELFLENKNEIIIEKDKYQNFKRNQKEKHIKNNMSVEYYK